MCKYKCSNLTQVTNILLLIHRALSLKLLSQINLFTCCLIFRFPKDSVQRRAWLKFARCFKENWDPTPRSVICSKHFASECFNRNKSVRLKSDAIPSLNIQRLKHVNN